MDQVEALLQQGRDEGHHGAHQDDADPHERRQLTGEHIAHGRHVHQRRGGHGGVGIVAHRSERALQKLERHGIDDGGHRVHGRADQGHRGRQPHRLLHDGAHEGHRGRPQHTGVAEHVEDPQHRVPRGTGAHHVGVGHHHHEHGRQRDGEHSQPRRHLPLVAAQVHQVHDGRHGQHHDGDELLGDAAGQMSEAVEDAFEVLQMEEHRDAAGRQQHGRGDPAGQLGLGGLTAQGQHCLGAEHAGRPGHQGSEQNQRPLQFHNQNPLS